MEEIIANNSEVAVPYGDLYLKFTSEEEANAVLEGYPGSIDVIGEIEGATGWHVNTRGQMLLDLMAFAVNPEPTTPMRVWA